MVQSVQFHIAPAKDTLLDCILIIEAYPDALNVTKSHQKVSIIFQNTPTCIEQ